MKQNKFLLLILALIFVATIPWPPIFAQNLSSSNYSIENPTFDSGGQNSTSTNYVERESIGVANDSQSSSSNYNIFPGFLQHAYPGVPGQPTLINTGGTLYNSLDYTINAAGNASDTQYAIAISSDSFATTNFIQADNSFNTSTVWQTFSVWGGGGRVTGLAASTTYQIKVKARFGPNTETAYSLTASATTSNPSFTMTIAGISSGTLVAGATTTITTSANAISFGSLVPNATSVAAQLITVTTNASGGYTTTIQEDKDLTNQNNQAIAGVSGTNASPAAFPASVSTGAFGYHTNYNPLCTGSVNRFAANNTYAAATSTPSEISCAQNAVSNEQTSIVYQALIGSLQASGNYTNNITYISTGKY